MKKHLGNCEADFILIKARLETVNGYSYHCAHFEGREIPRNCSFEVGVRARIPIKEQSHAVFDNNGHSVAQAHK